MVSAVSSGRQDDATEHREDGEHGRKTGTAGTAIRRQLLSIIGFGEGLEGTNISQTHSGAVQHGQGWADS
jgi:hypothetical protein